MAAPSFIERRDCHELTRMSQHMRSTALGLLRDRLLRLHPFVVSFAIAWHCGDRHLGLFGGTDSEP